MVRIPRTRSFQGDIRRRHVAPDVRTLFIVLHQRNSGIWQKLRFSYPGHCTSLGAQKGSLSSGLQRTCSLLQDLSAEGSSVDVSHTGDQEPQSEVLRCATAQALVDWCIQQAELVGDEL